MEKPLINLIGKRCQIKDNSFAFTLATGNNPYLALTRRENSENRPICKIVSEPYFMEVETINGIKAYEFITVTHDDLLHVVLCSIDLVK